MYHCHMLYTYECPEGHKTEKNRKHTVRKIKCECGKTATRTVTGVPIGRFVGDGFTRSFA